MHAELTIRDGDLALVAKDWNNLQVAGADGTKLVTFTGFDVKPTPSATSKSGEIREIKTAAGHKGLEIVYQTARDGAPSPITVTGRFVLAGDRLDVNYEVSNVPDDAKVDGSMFGRRFANDASEPKWVKLGLWERHSGGGVPYEVPDGKLMCLQTGRRSICFAFNVGNKSNEAWKDAASQHAGLAKIGLGKFGTSFSVLFPPGDWPAEATAARWQGRPLALHIGTDRPYNWWSDLNSQPSLQAVVANTSDEKRDVDLKYWVRDFGGNIVAEQTREISLHPGQQTAQTIEIKAPSRREILFAEVSAIDKKTGKEVFARTNLTVLPPHEFRATSANSIFGIAAYWPIPTEEDAQRVMERMGVRWLRNGDTRLHKNITANRHSNIKWKEKAFTPEEREAWIKKELQTCVEQKNEWWEFGNELNMSTAGIAMEGAGIGKALLAEKYIEWLREIRRIQKETGTTQVKIMSFGLAGMDMKFIDKFGSLGGWDLIDGFALHPGRGNFTPDYPASIPSKEWSLGMHGNYWNFYGSVRTARQMLDEAGGNKPLWLTEVYAPTFPNSFWEDSLRHATENVVLTFALSMAEGVRGAMWYQLFDSVWYDRLGVNNKDREYHFGLINRDLSFKPMLLAYCTIAEALDEARFNRWLNFDDKDVKGLLFDTPRGPMAVLWNRADGYVLSQKSENYASPEPWVDTWKTRTPIDLPTASSSLKILNPIGQEQLVPAENGIARTALTGAPVIVYGLDTLKLSPAP